MPDLALVDNPKLYQHVERLREAGYTIEVQRLGSQKGPGFATHDGRIVLNNWHLRGRDRNFPEDRLLIVLFHEAGHIKHFMALSSSWPVNRAEVDPADSEYWAFENSIVEATKLAKAGDSGPLATALHWISWRKNSDNEPPHYRSALDRIINSDLWHEAEDIVSSG